MLDKPMPRPPRGFWFVAGVVVPAVNVVLVVLDFALCAAVGLGVAPLMAILAGILALELAALRGWLVRRGVSPGPWITPVATVIVLVTACAALFVLSLVVAATGD